MKNLLLVITILIPLTLFFSHCNKDESNNTGAPGILGDVGNVWNVKVNGIHDLSTEITAKEGNVVTLQVSYAKITTKTLKFGLLGNEVVDYVYSQGNSTEPFTMVKFDANVGDMYYANINGITHYREVTEKNTYNVPALGKDLEMIGVYEEIPYEIPSNYFGYTIREIIWYWHPDYGLVCVDCWTDDGEYIKVVFIDIEI